jgi:hypothetical protein
MKFHWKNYSKALKLFYIAGISFTILLVIPTALNLRNSLNIWLLVFSLCYLGFTISYHSWYNREREAQVQKVGQENVRKEMSRNK